MSRKRCVKCGRYDPPTSKTIDGMLYCKQCAEDIILAKLKMDEGIIEFEGDDNIPVRFKGSPAWQSTVKNRAIITIPKNQINQVDFDASYDIIMIKIKEEDKK